MKSEIIETKNKEEWLRARAEDVTSTEISALFGFSPYVTEFELYHNKLNKVIVGGFDDERVRWGSRLEESIAYGIAEDQKWKVQPKKHYIRLSEERLGSSFDFEIEDPKSILEIKNVDSLQFKDRWIVDGDEVQAPPHIEMQLQHQMLVSGLKSAIIGALIGGNRVVLIERALDDLVAEEILKRAKRFWDRIKNQETPEPNFERDAKFIVNLMNRAKEGSVIQADANLESLVLLYKEQSEMEKKAAAEKQAIKAQILMAIGEAEKVLGDGWSLSCGIIAGGPVSFVREPYRNFKPYFKKEKSS